ncbi:hypothetical protein UB46_25790 [Burkholderiaceae bacterium 16]|nr:hypothetical protein UB46_25790 [Burkholderiaceae bacterium 16]
MAPFFVVVTDPTGNTAPLVSVSTVTPAAGAKLTLNATPLTTAIVVQLAADGNPLTFVSGKTVDAAALQKVTANVVAQLASVLAAIGAPASYDPFSTAITAATATGVGNTADQVLDIVKVVTDPATGKLALTTVDNPTPIAIATATSTGGTLAARRPPPAAAAAAAALPQAAQAVAKGLSACFALPAVLQEIDTGCVAAVGSDVLACGRHPVDLRAALRRAQVGIGGRHALRDSHNKTLLSDLVPATQGVSLPWNTLGSQSLAALDPSNASLAGAQTSLTADWVQNVSAQQIGSVAVSVDSNGTWSTSTPAPKGATSIVVNSAVPAFSANTTRGLLFGYRMLDNSNKSAVYTYN